MGRYQYAPPEPEKARMTGRDLCGHIMENTTAHGMPHIANANGVIKKGYWLILSLAFLVALGFHAYTITDLYFSYPINVVITLQHEDELTFPAVSVCNMSPIRSSAWTNYQNTTSSLNSGTNKRRKKRAATSERSCPAGWTEVADSCVTEQSKNMKSWHEARLTCQGYLGDLVSIDDEDVQNVVAALIVGSDHWIGLAQGWLWRDGSPVSWKNWYTVPSHTCAYVDKNDDYKWGSANCSLPMPAVCSIDKNGPCPGGFSYSGVRCYATGRSAPWRDADSACAVLYEGARLAKVDTEAESDFLIDNLFNASESYWIGLMEDYSLSRWSDETPVAFDNYGPGEPGTSGGCINIKVAKDWEKNRCSSSKRFVCEKPLPCTSTGATCVTDCGGLSDGDYQFCERCDAYVTCDNAIKSFTRCSGALLWDDTNKTCNTTSTTCTECDYIPTTTEELTTEILTTDTIATTENDVTTSSTVTTDADPTSTTTSTTTTVTTPQPDTCSCCCGNTYVYVPPAASENVTSPVASLDAGPAYNTESEYQDRPVLREDFTGGEEVVETLADIRTAEKRALGYSISDLILDCQFEGAACYYSDFDWYYNPIHGNCYAFNAGWNHTVKKSKHTGRRHGLHITVNINQDDYSRETGDTAGVRLVVHPGDRMAFPEDEGITVGPGMVTNVGIKQVNIKRQRHPYGACVDIDAGNPDRNVYEEIYPVKYSVMACQKTCLQRAIITECGCAAANYPTEGQAFPGSVPVCSITNISQDDCKYGVEKKLEMKEIVCDCPNSCDSTIFSLELSTGQWPSDVQKESVLGNLGPQIADLWNDPDDPAKYTRNLLKLEIFYQEFNFETISEVPAYRSGNFASDLGGVLGLWFGLSLFTVFEFVEFFMDMCVYFVNRCRRSKVTKMPPGDAAKERAKKERGKDEAPKFVNKKKLTCTLLPGLPLNRQDQGQGQFSKGIHAAPESTDHPRPPAYYRKWPNVVKDKESPPPPSYSSRMEPDPMMYTVDNAW